MATHSDMGPAAFMWPPDRVWSAAADNQAPCGSVSGVGNRTDFPLNGGQIALVSQDDAMDLELSIARVANPQSNDDFSILIDVLAFRELDLGHTCITIVDSPSSVSAGDNATLQIKYISEFDTPRNQTFYACADIVYVADLDFDMDSKCFNATRPSDDSDDSDSSHSPEESSGSDKDEAENGDDSDDESSGGGSSGLSGGAIAGIVIGAVAGVAALAAGALMFYRRKQQRLRAERQRESARVVKVTDQAANDSVSNNSVRLNNL